MNKLEDLQDLKSKVKQLLVEFFDESDKLIDHLQESGADLAGRHHGNLQDYSTPKLVVQALAMELQHRYASPKPSHNREAKNYFKMI